MAYGLNIYAPNGTASFSSEDPGCYFVSEKRFPVAGGTVSGIKRWNIPSICYASQRPLTFVNIPIGATMYAYDQFGAFGGSNDFPLAPDGVTRIVYTSIYTNMVAAPSIINAINTNTLADLGVSPSTSGYGIQIFSSTNKLILDSEVEIVNILASIQQSGIIGTATQVIVPSLNIDGLLGDPYFGVNLLGRMDESSTGLYCHKVYRSSENTFNISKWTWLTPSVSVSGPILTAGVNNGLLITGTIPFARF